MIETRQEVIDFLQADEYIDGNGFGYGNGSGFGSANAYGYGNSGSDECKNGSGYADGYKNGSGHGYGTGNSICYGNGSSHCFTYRYDKNVKVINCMIVHYIDGIPTIIDSVHGSFAKGCILGRDLTTNPCYIAKCGNYFAHGDTIENAFNYARGKYEENIPLEERIARFNEQYPDRNKKVPANELFNWHHTLTGSCLMGRKHFCKEHEIDYENGEYSVNEFIQLTKNAYNGDVIRQLEGSL